jgi:hypothetical protein
MIRETKLGYSGHLPTRVGVVGLDVFREGRSIAMPVFEKLTKCAYVAPARGSIRGCSLNVY